MTNDFNQRILYYNITFWICFITYEILIVYSFTNKLSPFFEYFFSYIVNISFFYLHAYLILPFVYKKKYYFFPSYFLFVFIYLILKIGLDKLNQLITPDAVNGLADMKLFLTTNIWRCIYFCGLSFAYWIVLHNFQKTRKIAFLEKRKLKDEINARILENKLLISHNTYLKTQINTHFLFNTLNFIHSSALKTAPRIAELIVQFSDVMRYSLSNEEPDGKVDLDEELEIFQTYIEINKLRYKEHVHLNLTIIKENHALRIIPLLMITLAENIFKYADLHNVEHPVEVVILVEGNYFKFIVNNYVLENSFSKSYGIGFNNLKGRLESNYKNNYFFNTNIEHNIFNLELSLNL